MITCVFPCLTFLVQLHLLDTTPTKVAGTIAGCWLGGLYLIFSSSHLLIFTPSHLHTFCHTFSSSHLLIFTPSHLHICSSSHLLIFTSAHLQIFSHICSSSHLLISLGELLGVCSSSHLLSHLLIFTSSLLSLSLFSLSGKTGPQG